MQLPIQKESDKSISSKNEDTVDQVDNLSEILKEKPPTSDPSDSSLQTEDFVINILKTDEDEVGVELTTPINRRFKDDLRDYNEDLANMFVNQVIMESNVEIKEDESEHQPQLFGSIPKTIIEPPEMIITGKKEKVHRNSGNEELKYQNIMKYFSRPMSKISKLKNQEILVGTKMSPKFFDKRQKTGRNKFRSTQTFGFFQPQVKSFFYPRLSRTLTALLSNTHSTLLQFALKPPIPPSGN